MYRELNYLKRYVNNETEKKELIDLFLEDYYTIFCSHYSLNTSESKKILKFLSNQKANKLNKKYDLEKIVEIICWVECYSKEIFNILKFFLDISIYVGDIYDKIKNILLNNKIKYENIYDFKGYTKIVNEELFYLFNIILKIITKNELYLNLLNEQRLSEFIKLN